MKKIFLMLNVAFITILISSESDWSDDKSWSNLEQKQEETSNQTFEETKIKNRSKKTYDDKVYKYITGDYNVENNDIELATIHLDDSLKNDDIEVNVLVDDLTVEGDSYKDSLDIKRNKYKNFVQNDERESLFLGEERGQHAGDIRTEVRSHDSRYNEVKDEDISEIEVIDLRDNDNIKEVNVFIERVDILVD